MAVRVLSSETGRASIQRIQSILNGGLAEQLAALRAEGQTLSDPAVWDGARAEEFRSSTWPAASNGLQQAAEALEELRARAQMINQDIMTAGGNA
jgi:hypothetical protein